MLKACSSVCSHSGSGSGNCQASTSCNTQSHVHAITTEIMSTPDEASEAPALVADSSDHLHDDDIDMHPNFQ